MTKKIQKFIFLALFLLFLANARSAFALEITYPNIPFYPALTKDSTLPEFISYWFGFAIMIAGAVALISLAIASVQIIASAGNPGARGDAVDRIKSALLGLVLLLSSFILLRTINPVLITPSLTPLGEVPGVFYTNGRETKPAPISEADTANIPDGFGNLIYKCAQGAYSPNLFIWKFPSKNFIGASGGYDGITVEEISCGQSAAVAGAGSFKLAFKTPGVYYFLGAGCAGYMSGPILSSESQITDPFKGNIKSIKLVNDLQHDKRYGVILHRDIGYDRGGICTPPLIDLNQNNAESCINLPAIMPASSSSIFFWNPVNYSSSGSGVEFYSKPYGWNTEARAGKNIFTSENIKDKWYDWSENIKFSYTNVDVPDAENCDINKDCPCPNFRKCTGSLRIKGNYLVALYAQLDNGSQYCQVFTKDAPNLKLKEFIGANNEVQAVDIFPTK